MPRNFCGFVDYANFTNPQTAIQMAKKLNINNLYQPHYSNLSKARFAGMYSAAFPTTEKSDFMRQMNSKYLITCFSFLIRRNELGKKLDLTMDLSRFSDEEIILRCYLKWGKDLVFHLEGDWAVAIWDASKEVLFLARNPHGDGTLFYYQTGDRTYFSSLVTGLVGIDGIPNELDREKLFMETMSASAFQTRTIYKNIHFLKPGHYQITSKSSSQSTQYWRPLEQSKVNFKKDEDYFDAFYESYDRAVCDRLKVCENWGFAISGGLDSAATLSIASNYYKKRNESLNAMSFVPTYRNEEERMSSMKTGDESEFARATAEFNGNVNLELITKDVPFWEFMEGYSRDFGSPAHMTGVLFAEALAEAGKNRGMNNVMIGQGGNQALSFEGVANYFDLRQYITDLRQGLLHHLTLEEFVRYLVKSLKGSGNHLKKRFSGHRRKRVEKNLDRLTLLSKEFIGQVDGINLLSKHYYGNRDRWTSEGDFKFKRKLKPGSHCRLGLWNQLGARYDMLFVDPSRDTKFLELAASFPNHIFNRKGEAKYLFKQTFKEKVAPEIMTYRKTGINLSDLINRYREDMDYFQVLIAEKENTDLFQEIIDKRKLQSFQNSFNDDQLHYETFMPRLYQIGPTLFHAFFSNDN